MSADIHIPITQLNPICSTPLSASDVQTQYASLFYKQVETGMVEAALDAVCKSSKCPLQQLPDVLTLIHQWKAEEDDAFWDFMSLDLHGTHTIQCKDALYLARALKGPEFDIDGWKQWESNRTNRSNNMVAWSDFKTFLYHQPDKRQRLDDLRYEEEYNALSSQHLMQQIADHKFYQHEYENDEEYLDLVTQEKKLYQESIFNETSRLVNRWNIAGIEAVIHDDGAEWERSTRDEESARDEAPELPMLDHLKKLVEEKYDALRSKLIWEAALTGNAENASREQLNGIVMKLQKKEKKYRSTGKLGKVDEFNMQFGSSLEFTLGGISNLVNPSETEGLCSFTEPVTFATLLEQISARENKELNALNERFFHLEHSQHFVLLASLHQQCQRAKEGLGSDGQDVKSMLKFEATCAAVGLDERLLSKLPRTTNDLPRLMLLAADRLRLLKIGEPYLAGSASQISTNQNEALWIELVDLIDRKHTSERKFLVGTLKNMQSTGANEGNLESKLHNLASSWMSMNKESPPAQRIPILQEAIEVYSQLLKLHSTNPSSDAHEILMLAQLQVHQDEDAKSNLTSSASIEERLNSQIMSINSETLDNIASLVFTQSRTTGQLVFATAVKEKYNTIIRRLLGSSDEDVVEDIWRNIINGKMEEQSRNAIESSSAMDIFGPKLSSFIQSHDKQQFGKRSQPDENGAIRFLCNMCYDEIHVIMSGIRDAKIDHESWKQIWQMITLKRTKSIRSAAITLGLQTRIWSRKNLSSKEDTQRFMECSQHRFEMPQPFTESDSNDLSLMSTTTQLHIDEWMRLRGMISDPSMRELCEAASMMSHDDRMKRLAQINSKRKKLDLSLEDDREDMISLLEEALALKIISRRKILMEILGTSDVDGDVAVTILADLHQEQIKDVVHWFNEEHIAPNNARDKYKVHMDGCENIFSILCKYEGNTGDQDLLNALYDRHALLRNKLLSSITEEEERKKALKDLNSKLNQESDLLLKMLGEQDVGYLNEKDRQALLMKMRRMMMKAEQEDKFDAAFLVGGMMKLQESAEQRLRSEQEEQRELARLRMVELKKRRLSDAVDDGEVVTGDRDAMQSVVMRKMNSLHAWERHWLVDACTTNKPDMKLEVNDTIQQLIMCRGKVPRATDISVEEHVGTLNKAVGLRLRLIGQELPGQPTDELEVKLLMALQKTQENNETEICEKLEKMSNGDLVLEQERLSKMIKMKRSSNLPKLLLWSSASEEDEILEAIQDKLDLLLEAAVTKAFQYKLGPEKQDTEDFRRRVREMKEAAKELMLSSRYDDALNLITDGLEKTQREEIVRMLLGDEEQRRKEDLKMREQRRDMRIKNGMSKEEADRLFREEGEQFELMEKKRRKNVLQGLFLDAEAEKDALIKMLKDANDKMDAERQRQLMLAKLRHRNKLLQRESDLTVIMKLMNMSNIMDDRLKDDKKQQFALAQERLKALKNKKKLSNSEILGKCDWNSDDRKVLSEAATLEIEAKHAAEREVLAEVMRRSIEGSEVRTKASKKSAEDRRERIRALRQLRRQWRNDPNMMSDQKDDQINIFLEASAYQLESIRKDSSKSEEDAHALMLMDLQMNQSKETEQFLQQIAEKSISDLREFGKQQEQSRIRGHHDNVASSLLGSNDEEEVIQALEEKYDVIKDKYLAEVLMKRLGSAEWEAMGERERQKKIMDVKRHERRLRQEGKTDELKRLFRALAISENDIERLSQEDTLKLRLERKKKLKEERAKQGLANDDETLERELDAEESLDKVKRKNVLLDLESDYENEKKSLLSDLRRHDDMISEERRRQLAAAHLRRERRQLQSEENYSAIMLIFQAAKDDKAALASNLEAGRSKQSALAKERLSMRKTKKRRKEALAALTDPEVILKRINEIMDEKREGGSLDILLNEVEQKHLGERNSLLQLLLVVEDFDEELKQRTDEELREELERFMGSRRKWRESRMMLAISESGDEALDAAKKIRLSTYVSKQNNLLINGMKLQLELNRRALSGEVDKASWMSGQLEQWMTELQHTQDNETVTTTNLTFDKTNEVLNMLSEDQVRARRERWNDNLVKVLFGLPLPGQTETRPASSVSLEQEQNAIEEEAAEELKKLDEELEEKKETIARKKREGEDIDADAAFAQLEKDILQQKEALNSNLEQQRAKMMERMQRVRQRRDETEFEAHAAAGMVLLAEQRIKAREKRATDESNRQKNLMEKMLAERREQRKKAKVIQQPEASETKPPPPPIQPMKREKTVIDIHISEKEKDDFFKELNRKSQNYMDAFKKQQELNKLEVQKQIDARKKRKGAQVVELMNQLDRQKTMFHERTSLQLTRQKTELNRKIERIKTEKTIKGDQTMTSQEKRKGSKFLKLAQEANGEDEMDEFARNLQKKLEKENEAALPAESVAPLPVEDKEEEKEEEEFRPRSSSRRLGKTDQDQIVKDRMLKRKKKRVHEDEAKEDRDDQ